METHIDSLLYRARRVNFEFNHSEKYLEQFKTDEYYTKIGNRLDDLLRISYYLVKFFISTPPKYTPSKKLNIAGEALPPYGEEDPDIPAPLEYDDENFSLYTLTDLPAEIEAEFDFNYFAFYSFLAYLKPSYYFVHDYEVVPKGRAETQRERVTRVLTNLVLLLSFVRSFDEKQLKDVMVVISSLFFRFEKLFSISYDDSAYNNYIFFQEYPNQAAVYTIFSLLYDERTLDEFKDHISIIFQTYDQITECEDYNTALQAHKFTLESLLSSSEDANDFKAKLSQQYKLSDFKESLFKLSKTLANKILIEALEIPAIDLKRTFLSISYEDEIRSLQDDIKNIESKTREVAEEEKSELRKSLLDELEKKHREFQISEQEKKEKDEVIEDLNQQLDATIKNEAKNLRPFTSIQQFQKSYPELYQTISLQSFKLATQKCDGKINELEDQLLRAKSAEKHFKEKEQELRQQIEQLRQEQQEHQPDEVVTASPHWNYQEPPMRGSVEEVRSEYNNSRNGQSYQPQYDDRRSVGGGGGANGTSYYVPNNNPPPRYPPQGGYRGGPSRYREGY